MLVQLFNDAALIDSGIRGSQREAILGNRRFFIDGDILIAVGDHEITALSQLEIILEESFNIGDQVILTIIRNGKQMEVEVELTEARR